MSETFDPLHLLVPRNATGLMQLLQLLVGREHHRYWCGGIVPAAKLPAFVKKMAVRYPLSRNARQRSYDRKRGLAVVHFIAFPVATGVAWWLLSCEGKGGLADPASPDAHVAHDAMTAAHHIEFGDYVLLYANKRAPTKVVDKKTGKEKTVSTSLSTWTWKLRRPVVSELAAAIEAECRTLSYGAEGAKAWGLRGLLERLRHRPLFSGVRNQVIELHRQARDNWERRRPAWREGHPQYVKQYGELAGALIPLKEVMASRLPIMPRLKVYDDPPKRLRDLCCDDKADSPAV